jgi:hypothetical protein
VSTRTVSASPSLRPSVVAWRELAAYFRDEHRQGDHVSVVGPTDSGKSLLLLELAKLRAQRSADDGRPSRVTVLVTKPRDRTVDRELAGWPRIRSWPPEYGQEHVIVWPHYGDPETAMARQRHVFGPLLRTIFQEGGQTVVVDELARFSDPQPDGLGLGGLVRQYYTDARSLDLTMMGATQRPTHVPRAVWSEPKWIGIFGIHDHDDLRRLVEIGGNTRAIIDVVGQLGEHEFLLVRRRGGAGRMEMYVSKVKRAR